LTGRGRRRRGWRRRRSGSERIDLSVHLLLERVQ